MVLLAIAGEGTVAGYLVGALENPALQERFADISYFRTHFADLCRRFPAHLHINLSEPCRNRGIGAALVEAFAEVAARAGAPGMHIVTGRGMRNVRFYERCGFRELGSAERNGGASVFLARELATRARAERAARVRDRSATSRGGLAEAPRRRRDRAAAFL